MSTTLLAIGFLSIFSVIFYFSKPFYRVLASFLVMSSCFELLPYEISGIKLWDVGAIIFFISGYSYFSTNKENRPRPPYFYGYLVFSGILFLSFFYSIIFYNYPIVETIKASRQMLVGYLTFFVFIRLFKNDPKAFNKFHNFFYWFLMILMIINFIQFLTGQIIFQGYVSRKAEGALRSVPEFLPFASIYLWHGLSSYFTKQKYTFHNFLYIVLYLITLSISFTRGMYITNLFVLLFMIFILIKDKRFYFTKSVYFFIAILMVVFATLMTPKMDAFIERAATTLTTVFQLREETRKINVQENTFSLRIFILKERLALVAHHNPFLGYGFIHEDRAHNEVNFHYGTFDRKVGRLGFWSADIGWSNIVIYTGFLGLFLFSAFIFLYLSHHYRLQISNPRLYILNLSYFLAFLLMFIIMIDGPTFTRYVQIQMYILAASLHFLHINTNNISSEPDHTVRSIVK